LPFRRHIIQISSTGRSLACSASNHVERVAGARTMIIDLSHHTDSYERWQYAWSTNCSTTPSASHRTETTVCASLTPTVPRRPVRRPTTAAPRALIPRATGDTLHAAAAHGPGAAARRLEGRTDLALLPHTPVPVTVPALRSSSAACVHGG
jgi:hypothetical protein